MYFDPRAVELEGPGGVLHAKAVVADEAAVFITSANLTEAALDRNIEMGILVRGPVMAASVIAHFRQLIDRGLLHLLPEQAINAERMGLKEAEEKVQQLVNWIGDLVVQEVVEGIEEPTCANRIEVGRQPAVFEGVRNLRFINRFGEEVVRGRRCYKFLNRRGTVAPLDLRLGMESCFGFSPLMTFLVSMMGADDPYERAAQKLKPLLGFKVSSTAVQRTTEKTGERIPQDPYRVIDAEHQQQDCELMVVEVDGTTSPQISATPGVTGRESLKAATCYKECNVLVIEKRDQTSTYRWTGACYGPRKGFEEYARRAGLQMGFINAKQTLFIADGAHHNWQLQMTHFPQAIQILDYYHARQHLTAFCELLPTLLRSSRTKRWSTMMWEGDVLQLIAEMKQALPKITDSHSAWGQINYFDNNKDRMEYDRYRQAGWPIGSGSVEAQCKFVVGRRFKGNGMRWRPHDNECVLRTRLAFLNSELEKHFRPQPGSWKVAA